MTFTAYLIPILTLEVENRNSLIFYGAYRLKPQNHKISFRCKPDFPVRTNNPQQQMWSWEKNLINSHDSEWYLWRPLAVKWFFGKVCWIVSLFFRYNPRFDFYTFYLVLNFYIYMKIYLDLGFLLFYHFFLILLLMRFWGFFVY